MKRYLYNYPEYYDVLYGFDRYCEAFFYDHLLQLFNLPDSAKVLEVACGTAMISSILSRFGWQMSGLDLSHEMINYAQKLCGREKITLIQGDMAEYREKEYYHAAFCPAGSLGLLHNDEEIVSHLQNMAYCLQKDGIYILDVEIGNIDYIFNYADVEFAIEKDGISIDVQGENILVYDSKTEQRLNLIWGRSPRIFSGKSVDMLISKAELFDLHSFYRGDQSPDGPVYFDVESPLEKIEEGRVAVILRKK